MFLIVTFVLTLWGREMFYCWPDVTYKAIHIFCAEKSTINRGKKWKPVTKSRMKHYTSQFHIRCVQYLWILYKRTFHIYIISCETSEQLWKMGAIYTAQQCLLNTQSFPHYGNGYTAFALKGCFSLKKWHTDCVISKTSAPMMNAAKTLFPWNE